ncbi:MAG TPA: PilN domain-containing protein [Myxococcota bacterium]|jgi:type IV pilus assembly protein PilN|nr:PilN domain-containing protein [Myxococcota bacterium]
MLRINLLPVKAEAKRELGQRQLILFVVILVAALVGLYFFDQTVSADVEAAAADVAALQDKVTALESSVKDREVYVAKRRDLLAQKAIFIELHGRRSGPSKMLHELAMLLSPGRGPSNGWSITKDEYEAILKESPGSEIHLGWDPTRIWIERLGEDSRMLTIEGFAKSNDDVAELQKRLSLSHYFDAVELGSLSAEENAKTKERTIAFTITAVVNYSPLRAGGAAAAGTPVPAPTPAPGSAAPAPKSGDGAKGGG